MDKEMKMLALERWAEAIEQAGQQLDKITLAVGLDIEGPTHQAFDKLNQALTQATADLLDDHYFVLAWYWLENDMGRKGHPAGPVGAPRPIKMLDDLLWLIEVEGAA